MTNLPYLNKRKESCLDIFEKKDNQPCDNINNDDFKFNFQGNKASNRKLLAKAGTIKLKECMTNFFKPVDFRNQYHEIGLGEPTCSYLPKKVSPNNGLEMISQIRNMLSQIKTRINNEKKFSKVMAIECVNEIIHNTKKVHNRYAFCEFGQKKIKLE